MSQIVPSGEKEESVAHATPAESAAESARATSAAGIAGYTWHAMLAEKTAASFREAEPGKAYSTPRSVEALAVWLDRVAAMLREADALAARVATAEREARRLALDGEMVANVALRAEQERDAARAEADALRALCERIRDWALYQSHGYARDIGEEIDAALASAAPAARECEPFDALQETAFAAMRDGMKRRTRTQDDLTPTPPARGPEGAP